MVAVLAPAEVRSRAALDSKPNMAAAGQAVITFELDGNGRTNTRATNLLDLIRLRDSSSGSCEGLSVERSSWSWWTGFEFATCRPPLAPS